MELWGFNLIVDKEDQVWESRVALGLDAKGLLQVLQGLTVAGAEEFLEGRYVEVAHWVPSFLEIAEFRKSLSFCASSRSTFAQSQCPKRDSYPST